MSRYDLLDLAYLLVSAGIDFSVLGWMFFRLEKLWARQGSLDLYWFLLFRLIGWQLLAWLIYAFFYSAI